MKIGKVSNEMLNKVVFNNIIHKRNEVIQKASIGMDTSIVDLKGDYLVVSADPITGATKDLGKLAANIAINDIATAGADPFGILVTVLLPENSEIKDLEILMKDLGEECDKLGVEIVGGHTEVTKVVNQIVIMCTALGKVSPEKRPNPEKTIIGDKIILSKKIPIEGTSIIAKEREDELSKILSERELKEAKEYSNSLSVVKEGIAAAEFDVKYMHDITEGGVLGALWETSCAVKKGIKVYKEKIPVIDTAKKIGEYFNIDIYKLIASGSMLIVMGKEDAHKYIEKLQTLNIEASIVGEVSEKPCILLIDGDREIVIDSPQSDELYNI